MEQWLEKDLKYIWHPYTQFKDSLSLPPILIDRAKGVKLLAADGNFYYDTIASWWCNVHGHNHPKIKAAIKKQLDALEHVLFAGFTHRPAIELAEKLVELTPNNLTRVFYSDNGSTAVEVALKISFQYWRNVGQKTKARFVSLDHGYHGDTIGAMSVSGVDLFNEMFRPLFFQSYKVPSPYCYRCPYNKERASCHLDCLTPLEKLLQEKNSEIAAIILEPLIMAAGGMIIYPSEYLKRAYELAQKYHVHLILDEVATGFGRTGKMFAVEHTPTVKPDFMCLSKGITGGYLPLAATLMTAEIAAAFTANYLEKKTFFHGHTYSANPLACAAALASLEIFASEETLNHVRTLIPQLRSGLAELSSLPHVGDVRHLGMIGAIELVKDKEKKTPFKFNERLGYQVYKKGLERHLILRPLGDIIYLFLPLAVQETELKEILTNLQAVLEEL